MSSIEARGRTVDEAVRAALEKMRLSRDEVDVEILEEPSRGFLGLIGSKEALVKVTPSLRKEEYASRLLKEVFDAMKVSVQLECRRGDGYVELDVFGEGSEAMIGRRGETLNALQFLVNIAASQKSADSVKIILDVEGYRRRRRKRLEQPAARSAEKARRTGERVALEPMGAADRRIVHLTLQGMPDVTSHSEGNEPFRRVVIARKR